jgi:Exostosin family
VKDLSEFVGWLYHDDDDAMKLLVNSGRRQSSFSSCFSKKETRRPLFVRRRYSTSFNCILNKHFGTVLVVVGTLCHFFVDVSRRFQREAEVTSVETLSAYGTPPYSMLHLPELTTWLIGNFTDEAMHFYNHHALNEEQGEIWLHRGFLRLKKRERWKAPSVSTPHENQSVIIICAYLHFNQYLYKKRQQLPKGVAAKQQIKDGPPYSTDAWMRILQDRVEDAVTAYTAKSSSARWTFLLAVPTWNPTRGNEIGLSQLSKFFYRNVIPRQAPHKNIRYVSLGYERNVHWQKVASPHDILPIPYVVTVAPKNATEEQSEIERIPNSIFYVGDTRPHAVRWSGCNRTALLQPLQDYYHVSSTTAHDTSPVYVRLIPRKAPRLSMDEYHRRMAQSHYCLIVCGDTPTSRSLASALVHGCTPLFIGIERWYGYCDDPCHAGWGWTVLHNGTNLPASHHPPAAISHFPFASMVDYCRQFPSVKEQEWAQNPVQALQTFLQQHPPALSLGLQEISMFLYGSGNPVTTEDFGSAVPSIWESFVQTM